MKYMKTFENFVNDDEVNEGNVGSIKIGDNTKLDVTETAKEVSIRSGMKVLTFNKRILSDLLDGLDSIFSGKKSVKSGEFALTVIDQNIEIVGPNRGVITFPKTVINEFITILNDI